MYLIVILVLVVIAAAVYVRLVPADATRWHQPIDENEDSELAGGAIRVRDASMLALPRTRVLAGSLEDGLITYETRSQLWGFPDYTTIQFSDGTLKLFGRLRFGASDLGVNAARLASVLAAIE